MASGPLTIVRQRRQTVSDQFLRLRNVVGVGVGYKVRGGQQTDDLSITVSVIEKVPPSQLPPDDLVPHDVDGVPTDVVRTGPIYAFATDRRGEMRPARPGVSIGHYLSTAGTLGCLVHRHGDVYILSNNHVLAEVNQGQAGDAIYQPGPVDGGTASDRIAVLADYVRLRLPGDEPPAPEPEPGGCSGVIGSLFGTVAPTASPSVVAQQEAISPPNQVDAALARPLDPSLVNPDILDIGTPTGIAEPALNAPVRKSGRTTGLTDGTVQQIDVTADVTYGEDKLRFVNQVITSPMSRPGDSGSAIVDDETRVVGLLFAGSDYVTLFNPITFVIAALDVEIVVL